ncbi:AI-2E family transporter [Glaciihabitans arcticus]|uniref:AI-2E family transporter n=1 Tax=Glaciihabitans arcticus TaxID=2668039 RepID=A0A4Q9GU09_9MICO|nr:AI-2E family transporter [Glaciihabitans arcticus]
MPEGVKLAGAWAWRLLAIAAVLVVIGLLIIVLREIIVPFMVAILISALLVPVVNWLVRHRWPKALAVLVALVATLVVVAGLITLIVAQVRSGYPDLQARSLVAFEQFKTFLAGEPFFIDSKQLQDYIDQTLASVDNGTIWSGAVTVSTTAGHFLVGLLLTIFATIFILIDGKGIWNWIVRIFPRRARPAIDGSGKAGWLTLTTFVKVQIFVAFVDAVGIGLGAFILGLFYRDQGGFPLVIPIAIAVFLGSFIPVVGAVVTGIFAVFVALVFLGPVPAIIMLGIVLLVQQVEGHILQPLVMGSAVKVHPLAVVFAVAAGSGIAGIVGALFAVPVVAVANVMVTYIASGKWRTQSRPLKKDVVSQV